jgi:tetratricopeptide (TPR) repeat protein
LPPARARRLLAELAGANLLIALDSERYTYHDLIRAYALEQAQQRDSDADRSEMLHRLLDHYLHTAHVAAGRLDTYRDAIVSTEPRQGVVPAPLADHEQALEWLITEYPTLLAIIRQAEESGFDAHSWQLACTLTEFFERRGLWHGWLEALTAALSAAERLGDRRALAYSHRGLGRAHQWLGDYADADLHHRQALAHFTHLGDRLGQARVWHSLGRLAELRGQLEEALSCTQSGLELFRSVGDRPGIAKALNGVGWYHCLLGDYRQALDCCGEALLLLQELGDRRVEANAWDSLAYAHNRSGDHGRAIECYDRALTLFREIGDRFHEGNASVHLGNAYADAGDLESARRTWQTALVILDDLGHADAERVRAKLDR